MDAEDDEVEIVPNFAFDFERLEPCPPSILHREIRPPTPRSEATLCAVTRGNIAELAATAFVPLLIVLLSVRTIGYRGEQCSGGEGVSQSPLKDKTFSSFLGENPPFELRRNMEFRLQSFHGIHRGSSKYRPNTSIFHRRRTAGSIGVCPPKAKATRSNRVGSASFSLFCSAVCALR